MSKSLIQTVNAGPQAVAELGVIGLGTTVRRYGCNLHQISDAIEAEGCGYYTIDATVTLTPDAVGPVSVAVYNNGVAVPGTAVTGSVAAAGDSVTLPIVGTIRQGCNCNGADSLTLVITDGASTVTNVSMRVVKE